MVGRKASEHHRLDSITTFWNLKIRVIDFNPILSWPSIMIPHFSAGVSRIDQRYDLDTLLVS